MPRILNVCMDLTSLFQEGSDCCQVSTVAAPLEEGAFAYQLAVGPFDDVGFGRLTSWKNCYVKLVCCCLHNSSMQQKLRHGYLTLSFYNLVGRNLIHGLFYI
jgi:hypothetical protein